ncbi:unnamed protein product [Symbiodinium microadriaticum]|nr:unnamed protein product [Symbiodinium sp. KB8]CAE7882038.1 unnamed protein product [Symbiodinium microadriaticum]
MVTSQDAMASAEEVEPELVVSFTEDPIVADVASLVASMEPIDPSILRATRAWRVLQCFGAALRGTNRDLYERSFPVSSIQVFWSHSWHGNNYMKRLLLILLYSGPAAAIAATISALLMMSLHIAGVLPGLPRASILPLDEGLELVFAPWCLLTAGVVFAVVLVLWRSNRLVFLDQVCIHQTDAELKDNGILSLGAFLKYSEQFLLVWDSTYAGRLYCLLELAAFLTSHERPQDKVTVRLTAMAPCILGLGLAMWASMLHWVLVEEHTPFETVALVLSRWLSVYIAASYLREHYRTTEVMLKQLADFTVQGAQCHCCNDEASCIAEVCDRAVITRCIRIWYGSVEAFEVTVRTHVRRMLYRQLGGLLFPYRWQVLGALPLFWGFADLIAARGRAGNWKAAAIFFLASLTWCFLLLPTVFQVALLLAKYFRAEESGVWRDRLKSTVVALVVALLSFLGNWTALLVADVFSASLWMGGSAMLFGISWLALQFQAGQSAQMLDAIGKDVGESSAASVAGKPPHELAASR